MLFTPSCVYKGRTGGKKKNQKHLSMEFSPAYHHISTKHAEFSPKTKHYTLHRLNGRGVLLNCKIVHVCLKKWPLRRSTASLLLTGFMQGFFTGKFKHFQGSSKLSNSFMLPSVYVISVFKSPFTVGFDHDFDHERIISFQKY